jgi:hypothetical protein
MAHVEKSKQFDASADEMWQRIGDFQALDAWHPAIASCTPQEGGEVRSLGLADGSTVVERCVNQTDRSYTYRILEPGPLPVADYESTIAVRDGENGGSVVDWSVNYTPVGASEAEANEIIAGIFDGGLNAL